MSHRNYDHLPSAMEVAERQGEFEDYDREHAIPDEEPEEEEDDEPDRSR